MKGHRIKAKSLILIICQNDMALKINLLQSHGGASRVKKMTIGRFPDWEVTFVKDLQVKFAEFWICLQSPHKFVWFSQENMRLLKFLAYITVKTENRPKNMRIILVCTCKPISYAEKRMKMTRMVKKAEVSPSPPSGLNRIYSSNTYHQNKLKYYFEVSVLKIFFQVKNIHQNSKIKLE